MHFRPERVTNLARQYARGGLHSLISTHTYPTSDYDWDVPRALLEQYCAAVMGCPRDQNNKNRGKTDPMPAGSGYVSVHGCIHSSGTKLNITKS